MLGFARSCFVFECYWADTPAARHKLRPVAFYQVAILVEEVVAIVGEGEETSCSGMVAAVGAVVVDS